MKKCAVSILAPLFVVMMTGCATVSMVDSWKDPKLPPKSYRDFLVVGISQKWQMRQVFEEVFTAELRKRGISATPSYTITGVEEKPSRESLERAVRSTSADAVITARIVATKQETVKSSGYVMTDRGYTNPIFSRDDVMPVDLFGFYGASTVSYATFDSKPVDVTTSTTTTIETNLFDVATKKLVWSNTANAVEPAGFITASEDFAKVVIKAMSKEGFIP